MMGVSGEHSDDDGDGDTEALLRQRKALVGLSRLNLTDLASALPRLLEQTGRALAVERASYWSLSPGGRSICCEGLFRHADGTFSSGEELHEAECPSYFAALLQAHSIVADDAGADARTGELAKPYFHVHGITSLLDVPVWHRGRLVGVLCHEHVGPMRQWAAHELDFVMCVSTFVTGLLEGTSRRQAETRYELIGKATQDLLWDLDFAHRRIAWSHSPGAFGYAEGQLPAELEGWARLVHPDDHDRVTASLEAYMKSGTGAWREEYRFRRGDGGWAVVVDRGFLECDEQGQPRRLVGTMMDVTDQRRLHDRLRLSERLASVGTLAAGVAHEINNPLAYVQLNLQYALEALRAQPVPAALGEALTEAADGVERVRRIVRDLKAFSRPESDVQEAVDLQAVVDSAANMAATEIRHRAQLRREFDPVPTVWANSARVGQVVLNLMVNAAHAIPEHQAAQHCITVRTGTTPEGHALVEVRDTGSGVPPELLGRVFDPFFTTKSVGTGSGIGLTISHAIVSSLGGTLTLENNAGGGCTARMILPLGGPPDGVSAGRTADAASLATARRGRILVLDDEAHIGAAVRRMLTRRHDVQVHTRAAAALQEIREGARYDLVLCDLMMPELSGPDFVDALQRIDPVLARRVVLMTGGAFTERTREFVATARLPVLEKPFDPDELLIVVEGLVSSSSGVSTADSVSGTAGDGPPDRSRES